MAVEVAMPKWGLSMQEGRIVQWLKQEGETVAKDEPLLEVESDKMVAVVDSPAAGLVARILCPEDSQVPVGQAIAVIAAPGEALPEQPSPADAPAAAQTPPGEVLTDGDRPGPTDAPAAVQTPPTPPTTPAAADTPIIPAMPAARWLAREQGLDLGAIQPTGPGGAITKRDVEQALAAHGQPLQKAIFFSQSHRLDGLLYTPRDLAPGQQRPAVVLCPGYTYLKSLLMPDLARALNEAGYIALAFDYRGFGDSQGPRGRLMPQEQVDDVRAALTFAADQPQVNPARLAVLGVSLGGSNALVAGALDERVGAVVAIEAIGDGGRWLRGLRRHWEWLEFQQQLDRDRSQRVRTGGSTHVDPLDIVVPDPQSRDFLEAVYRQYPQMHCQVPLETGEALSQFRPEDHLERLSGRPVLFIHGADDRQVPVDEAHSLFARLGEPRQLEIVEIVPMLVEIR